MKKLEDLPEGLWAEMRYCMEGEISYFKPNVETHKKYSNPKNTEMVTSEDLANYPELTMEILPIFQRMIRIEQTGKGSLSKILRMYKNWLADLLSNYYDEGQYGPETDLSEEMREEAGEGNEWVGRLERLRDRPQ